MLSPLAIAVWIIAALVVGIAGPFGTFTQIETGKRLVYWFMIVGVSVILGRVIRLLAEILLKGRSLWYIEIASLLVNVLVLSQVILTLTRWYVPENAESIPSFGRMMVFVTVIVLSVILLRVLQLRAIGQVAPPPEPAVTPRLLYRLPETMRGEVLRLTGQGHLVEVVTTAGTTTVRIRFADAISEMEPVQGHCAHRSHWVTRAAIKEVQRENGRIYLKLANGDRVPVSRKYRPDLEAAGII